MVATWLVIDAQSITTVSASSARDAYLRWRAQWVSDRPGRSIPSRPDVRVRRVESGRDWWTREGEAFASDLLSAVADAVLRRARVRRR